MLSQIKLYDLKNTDKEIKNIKNKDLIICDMF